MKNKVLSAARLREFLKNQDPTWPLMVAHVEADGRCVVTEVHGATTNGQTIQLNTAEFQEVQVRMKSPLRPSAQVPRAETEAKAAV